MTEKAKDTAKNKDAKEIKTVKQKSDTKPATFAVIATGGKQYIVRKGDKVKVEKLPGAEKRKEGDTITFENVLLMDDGTSTKLGEPYIKGAKVEAKLIEDGRDKKLHVIRFRAKSRYFRKYGHRQPYTLVEITKV